VLLPPKRKVASFELGTLIDEVPLHRVVLLIDHTTDEPFLRRTLADLWRKISVQSPNASGGIARVSIVNLARCRHVAVRHLMRLGDEIIARSGVAQMV
jgi:hypothetical protein